MKSLKVILPLCVVAPIHAANIAWSSGSDFISANGHTNISTVGTHVLAYNFGGATATVDTGTEMITFVENQTAFSNNSFSVAGNSNVTSTSAAWTGIIHRNDFRNANNHVITLSGLTVGDAYQVELFAYDNRTAAIGSRIQVYTGGTGVSGAFTNQDGISVIGEFIADGATQDISIFQDPGGGPAVNALSLRNVPIPEPSTTVLGLFASIFLIRRRR